MIPRFFKSFKFSTIFSKNSVSLCLKKCVFDHFVKLVPLIDENDCHWCQYCFLHQTSYGVLTQRWSMIYKYTSTMPLYVEFTTHTWSRRDRIVVCSLSFLYPSYSTRLDSTLCHLNTKGIFFKNNSLMCTTNVSCLYACDITAMVLRNAVRFAGSLNTCSSGFYRSFNVVVVWNNARSHRQFHTHIENSLRQQ